MTTLTCRKCTMQFYTPVTSYMLARQEAIKAGWRDQSGTLVCPGCYINPEHRMYRRERKWPSTLSK